MFNATVSGKKVSIFLSLLSSDINKIKEWDKKHNFNTYFTHCLSLTKNILGGVELPAKFKLHIQVT